MNKETGQIITGVFVILCFIFVFYLFGLVLYETFITANIPTDNQTELNQISERYDPVKFVIKIYQDNNAMYILPYSSYSINAGKSLDDYLKEQNERESNEEQEEEAEEEEEEEIDENDRDDPDPDAEEEGEY